MPRLSKIGAAALAAFGWTSGSSVTASYLVVAGGGGGGGQYYAAGGGAGGYLTGTTSLNPTQSYTVTVGAGGNAGSANTGSSGSNSVFNLITSIGGGGGGGGGTTTSINGLTGGSGGGGGVYSPALAGTGAAGTSGQGNAGGAGNVGSGGNVQAAGGGGGGAFAAGAAGAVAVGGNGGAGTASSISGSSVTYAGGGGGGVESGTAGTGGSGGGGNGQAGTGTAPTAGTANLGGGGGGSGYNTSGGNGGSGVVIISYVGAQQFGGGVVTSSGGNTIHTFQTSGTLSPLSSLTANFLVIAGGGSGADYGGGGAGGLRSTVTNTGGGGSLESTLTIDTNSIYLVTVGAGGTGGIIGANGSNSVFFSIISTGGGRGANNTTPTVNGSSGGSGGGGRWTGGTGGAGTANQGFAGGAGGSQTTSYPAGGGGGAGAVGGNGTTGGSGGNGGAGVASSISGSSVTYAGGGGGGCAPDPNGVGGSGGSGGGGTGGTGGSGTTAGTANTGGGGGGAGSTGSSGGSGGSGVVIISYPGSTQQMAGGTVTVAGGNVIHTFTSSGYLAPIFTANNSLRFRSSASAYLNRTPASAGNRRTWTWSGWVKRGSLSSTQQGIFAAGTSANDWTGFRFNNDNFVFYRVGPGGGTTTYLSTTQVFRDPSAWYHIVLQWDTTQATSSDRIKLYINGVQVTAFSSSSYPTLNYEDSFMNTAVAHLIGNITSVSQYFDGYMTDINFVDGQALTPNSFGYYSDLGVWQPIRYGGSYGTNGFYLPFNAGTSSFAGLFNGSSQYLSLTANSSLQFGTGDFTVEGWYYQNGTVSFGNIFSTTLLYTTTGGLRLSTGNSNNTFQVATGGSSLINASVAFSASRWNHFAVVRSSGVTTLYQNGVSVGSASDSNSYTANTFVIGWVDGSGSSAYLLNGLLSNLRVVKGTAVYTANFTPSTSPLTAISGTSLLTLQNATIIDNSTNAFSITNNGTVTTGQTYPCSTALFNDQGPAGNNWTPNNISGASGSTLDYMTDVPTLTSATTANYAVLNPLDAYTNVTLSNANLSATFSAYTGFVRGTFALPSTGQWYWEGTVPTSDVRAEFGIATFSQALGVDPQGAAGCWFYYSNGTNTYKYSAGTATLWGSAWVSGDIIGIAFDASAGTISYYINGALQGGGVATSGLTGTYAPMVGFGNNTSTAISVNFGQRPFAYTPPTGFVALNTFNLPTPTIGATASTIANEYFDATLYTGTGSTQNITNSGSMQPDWVWIKNRSSTNSHQLTDSVRGVNLALASDLTIAEFAGNINAFNTNGFQVTGASNAVNASGQTYVAWQWRASNTTAVTNTQGSITSTVSANTTAGFSVVTYTGNGTAGATWGHGLGVAPSFVIVKGRTNVDNWMTWHTSYGGGQYFIELNTTNALGSATNVWNNTVPTSSVVTVGTGGTVNTSSVNYVAYCFAQVAGYSAFGSYTGNGSTDGTFVYTGFRPRWILIKVSSGGTGSWILYDTAKNTYNVSQNILYPNLSNAEATTSSANLDILSNGFKLRTSNADFNGNTFTYIYAAFAENPFKYANAR